MKMDHPFERIIESLEPSLERLLAMEPVRIGSIPRDFPVSGVYLLSEGPKHLYVGRSRNIRRRLAHHSRPGATYRMAALAFRIAREETGCVRPAYRETRSRKDLMRDPQFAAAFQAAKARIRAMDVRAVQEPNPAKQAVLEVYVAVELRTPYNDWDTH
jgi:predicted GIY-YIG superfamily endonuclease